MRKKLKSTLLVSLFLCVSSCATPPDVPICTELSPTLGWCGHTVTNKEFLVEGEDWVKMNRESLRIPASSWARLKTFMLTQCKRSKRCKANLGKWSRKAERFEAGNLLSSPLPVNPGP